jgi:hypothetical protein
LAALEALGLGAAGTSRFVSGFVGALLAAAVVVVGFGSGLEIARPEAGAVLEGFAASPLGLVFDVESSF